MTAQVDRHYFDTRGGFGRVVVVETASGYAHFRTSSGQTYGAPSSKFGDGARFHGPERLDGVAWCCACGKSDSAPDIGMYTCSRCARDICHRCLLTVPNMDGEPYDPILCSVKCWEKAGRPEA